MLDADRDAFLWIVEHRAGPLDPLFVGLSVAGYAGLAWIAAAALLAVARRRRAFYAAALTAVCVWTADLLTLVLKAAIDRPRPFKALPGVDTLVGGTVGDSFPSGHAATSFAGATVLALLAGRLAPVLFLLAAAVAYSRPYVGVHYPLDVAGGAALGVLVGLGFVYAFRPLPRLGEALQRGGSRRLRG